MLVSDYNYELPEERIAKFPPKERGSTRLLVLDRHTGAVQDSYYRDLADFLRPGDLLILNDTRVMRSRLFCELPDGRRRELVVLEKHGNEPQRVMYRGKLHEGDELRIVINKHGNTAFETALDDGDDGRLKAPFSRHFATNEERVEKKVLQPMLDIITSETVRDNGSGMSEEPRDDGRDEASRGSNMSSIVIKHILGNGIAEVESNIPLANLAEKYGTVPLPPYLHRDATKSDTKRYQTVWARHMGSAAAPTASLNMTDELLAKLRAKGVIVKCLTLHVGLGTFLPMRTDKVEDHKMHSEWFHIPDDTLQAIQRVRVSGTNEQKSFFEDRKLGRTALSVSEKKDFAHSRPRIVALGTTVARTLEYYARTGKAEGEDDIFIYPGYEFRLVNALITNFHAPKSTVLMLASAFAGWDHLKSAYDHAIAEQYNFLSYGDSMLIY